MCTCSTTAGRSRRTTARRPPTSSTRSSSPPAPHSWSPRSGARVPDHLCPGRRALGALLRRAARVPGGLPHAAGGRRRLHRAPAARLADGDRARELAGGADRRARRLAAALRAVDLRRRRRPDGRAAARRGRVGAGGRRGHALGRADGVRGRPGRQPGRAGLSPAGGLARGRGRLGLALGLDQRRLAALGERHGDRVEVARHDRVGEQPRASSRTSRGK